MKNNPFFHKLFYKNVIVEQDENGNPIKTIEKKRSLFLVWILLFILLLALCLIFIPKPHKIQFSKIILGSWVKALANATRCICPPDN